MIIKCIVPISGGKDSQACLKLAVARFGAKHVIGLFCDTKFEHDITYKHIANISEMYGVKIITINAGSVPDLVEKYKKFPGGNARFCTYLLKIVPSKKYYTEFAKKHGGFEVWYGMRSEESTAREKRYKGKENEELYNPHEVIKNYPQYLGKKLNVKFKLPVLDWSENEIFEYLDGEENPLYSHGFSRVGCFPCLAAGDPHKERAFKFDETGRRHFAIARNLEKYVGRSVFTSKRGQFKNDSGQMDCFEGCAICAI